MGDRSKNQYGNPQHLTRIFGTWEHGSREGVSAPDFADYRRLSTSFASLAAASNSTPLLNLKAAGEPEQVPSRNGRLGSSQRWASHRSTIAGKSFPINGLPYTVVGILPPFFNFLGPTDVFTPVQANPVLEMRGVRSLIMIDRLRDDVGIQQAQNELNLLSHVLQEEDGRFDRGWSTTAAPLTGEVVKDVKPALLMLFAAVALVVLLVSANVASLMLSQVATRHGEISLRLSLGASRARVVRQLLTESVILALAGGAAGAALAWWGVDLIKRFGPPTIPRLAGVTVDVRVLAFPA